MTDRAPSPARLALTVALGLLLTIPVGIAVAALSGVGHRWIDILAQFAGPALALAVAGLAGSALLRSRALIVASVLVCGLVLAAGWPQWAPPRGTPAESSAAFTLYSANLHALNGDTEAMARSIAASDADVVVLVEVGPDTKAALDTVLAGYPHRALRGRRDHPAAVLSVVASRTPLRDVAPRQQHLYPAVAVVETTLGPVTISSTHMTRPWPYQVQWEQIRQAEELSAWAATVEGPVIVAGDFNSVSSARIGKLIRDEAGLIPAPGWPGTWPTQLPAFAGITIDQVYHSPDLALAERRLGQSTGSDHRPVITRFVRAASPGE